MRRALAALGALAGLAGTVALAFPGLFRGERLLFRDTAIYFWPTRSFLASRLAAGELPWWFPLASCGQPFLANPKNSVLYPGNVLYLLLSFPVAFHLLLLLHLLLLGLGARAWLRRVAGAGRIESGLTAAALVSSGFVLSSVEFHVHVLALAWLPWVLLAAARAQRTGLPRHLAALAGAVAMLALAGEPYVGLLTMLLVALQTALGGPRSLRGLGTVAGGFVAGLALAAPQLVPSALHLLATRRVASTFGVSDSWALPGARLLELVLPNGFGPPDRVDAWGPLLWGESPLFLSIYPGVGALLLTAVALATCPRRWRWVIAGLGGAGLVLSATQLGRVVTSVFPLSLVRYRSKYVLLLELALTLGAALGLGALHRRRPRAAATLMVGAATVVAVAALALLAQGLWRGPLLGFLGAAGETPPGLAVAWVRSDLVRLLLLGLALLAAGFLALRRGRLAAWVVGLVTVGDLLLLAPSVNRTFPTVMAEDGGPLVAAVLAADHGGRLWRDQDAARRARSPGVTSVYWVPQRDMRTVFGLAGATVGIRNALDLDYDRMYDIASHQAWLAASTPERRVRLLRLSGVAWVVAEPGRAGGLDELAADPLTGVRLYAFPDPLPTLRSVAVARGAASAEERLELALSGQLDPVVETVVEGTRGAAAAGATAVVTVVEERANSLTARVSGVSANWLVWATTPSAGWRATIDGIQAPLHRADALALAVSVPAGTHDVRFEYRPPGLLAGCVVAVLAGLTLFGFAASRRRGRATSRTS